MEEMVDLSWNVVHARVVEEKIAWWAAIGRIGAELFTYGTKNIEIFFELLVFQRNEF